MNEVLVTGAAGFIGFHLCRRLLNDGQTVLGVDSLNDYYDVALKEARLAELAQYSRFEFVRFDLADRAATANLFGDRQFDFVYHMAAQAGVRYSLENPHAYADSNLTAFLNVLEGCRHNGVQHLVYASSSSVYGNKVVNRSSTSDKVDNPISLYAATKKANELMAHAYSHLYGLATTGLRFFTVYGPWGRPDMAIYKFADAIQQGRPIDIYNRGQMKRSFTYIDDAIEGVVRIAANFPTSLAAEKSSALKSESTSAPYRIFNLGSDKSVELERVITLLETALEQKAIRNYLGMQPGDVKDTCADIDDLKAAIAFAPRIPVEVGIPKFIDWYRQYTGVAGQGI